MADLTRLQDLDFVNFTENNWHNMSESQKLQALQNALQQAKALDIFNKDLKTNITFYDFPNSGTLGQCSWKQTYSEIRISRSHYLDPNLSGAGLRALATLFHEATHAEQHQLLSSYRDNRVGLQQIDQTSRYNNNRGSFVVCSDDICDSSNQSIVKGGEILSPYIMPDYHANNNLDYLFYCAQSSEQQPHLVEDRVLFTKIIKEATPLYGAVLLQPWFSM